MSRESGVSSHTGRRIGTAQGEVEVTCARSNEGRGDRTPACCCGGVVEAVQEVELQLTSQPQSAIVAKATKLHETLDHALSVPISHLVSELPHEEELQHASEGQRREAALLRMA